MSGDVAGRLAVEFGADLGPLKKELDEGRAKAKTFAADVNAAGDAAGGKLSSGAAAAAAYIRNMAIAALAYKGVELASKAVTDAAALEKTARAAGMTTAAFQQLAGGAKLKGFSGDLGPALEQFGSNATLARSKMGELFETLKFAAPALAAQLAATKTNEQALEVYAEAIRRVNGDEAKAILAKKAFGDAGIALIPVLAKGAEGLADLRKEADKYSVAVSGEAIKASKDLSTEIDVLATNAKNKFTNFIAPAVQVAADALKAARGQLAEVGAQGTPVFLTDGSFSHYAVDVNSATEALTKNADASKKAAAAIGEWKTSSAKNDGFNLQQKPDYRGADAVLQSVQQLAAARGELLKVAELEGKTAIEQARRVMAEGAMSAKEFATVRTNTEAATAAKIVEINRQTKDQLKQLEIEALTAREEGFAAIRGQYEMDLQTYSDLMRKKLITEEQFSAARENLNAVAGQKIKAENERLGEEARKHYAGLASAIETTLGQALTGTFTSASDAAKQLGISLADGLRKAITEALILKPIMDSIKGTGSGTGIAGKIGGMLGFPSSQNAEGGGIRAGVPTRINERAGRMPEVFIPSTAGRIVPGERAASMARGGSSAGGNATYIIDARGSDAGATQRIMAGIAAAEAQRKSGPEQQARFARRFPARA